MANEQRELSVWNTLTDALNAALDPLGILLSGVDAATILSLPKGCSVLEKLRTATEADIARITGRANQYCETDRIAPSHIRAAIERAKWHWQDE